MTENVPQFYFYFAFWERVEWHGVRQWVRCVITAYVSEYEYTEAIMVGNIDESFFYRVHSVNLLEQIIRIHIVIVSLHRMRDMEIWKIPHI